jgi:beta-N-acetylhexosaminidase
LRSISDPEEEFRLRVRDAARRVLTVKLEYLRGDGAVPAIPDPKKVMAGLPDPEGTAFFLDLAARSVTILKGDAGGAEDPLFPLSPDKAGRVLLAGQFGDFFKAGRAAYPGASSYWYSDSRGPGELIAYAREADTIIFCLSDAAGLGMLRNLQGLGKRVIIFSVLSPVYLDAAPWVEGAVAVYSYANESFIAGFSAMRGFIPAQGKLPFR